MSFLKTVYVPLLLLRVINGYSIQLTQRNNHENISQLLDNLLKGYDNSVRPDFGGPPATIEVDVMVRSMGPISEVDMTYSMDCYFRQSWVDRRLAFTYPKTRKGDTPAETLALSISMLARIWKPDTYFYNGKQSYLHTITTPNKFVRLYPDGRVLYSSRLTIKAGCPMNLENFPMDVQRCPLKFGSFGYTTSDILYRWNRARQAVAIAEDMKLSQFDLVDCPASNVTDQIFQSVTDSQGTSQSVYVSQYSMLLVSFHLKRHMGNFLIQVYGPCVLLVVLSWVSFWLNREATADRISLGITTVLTMTFLGLEARTDLPKVPYPTALDFFVFLSFGFIFATIIQFAIVHYFTKFGSGEYYFSQQFDSDVETDDDDTIQIESQIPITITDPGHNHETRYFEVIPLSVYQIPVEKENQGIWSSLFPCFRKTLEITPNTSPVRKSVRRISTVQTNKPQSQRRSKLTTPRFNSVSKIDKGSRIVFPLLFLIINLIYWFSYLYRSERLTSKSMLHQ